MTAAQPYEVQRWINALPPTVREPEAVYGPPRRRLLDQVRDALRTRHYNRRTEEAYVAWIRRFILFHGKRHPAEMGKAEIEQFLTALAVKRLLFGSRIVVRRQIEMPLCAILTLVLLAAGCGISDQHLSLSPHASCLTPHAFDPLRSHVEADIPPDEMEAFLGTGPPEAILIPLDHGSLYIERVPWSVVFVLLGEDGAIQETRSFVAFAFSVSWYQGLVVTLHHHPGTGIFYHQPMHVAVEGGKLLVEDVEPGWPARHAD